MEVTDSMLILSTEVNEKINKGIRYTAGILIIIILLLLAVFMYYYQDIFKKCINSVAKKMAVKEDKSD